jgi:CheY-like chemotaxis protein
MHNKDIQIAKPAKMPAPEVPAPTSSHKSKVLLVEDNKLNQRTLTLVLNKLGFSVVIANDGIEALNAITRDHFDMILMDCQMPNMDGYKATTQIRKSEEGTGHHIPIIGVTAHAMEGNRNKCMEAGMDNYISKPYSVTELNKMIKKSISTFIFSYIVYCFT